MKKKLLLGLALGAMVMTTACGQAKVSNNESADTSIEETSNDETSETTQATEKQTNDEVTELPQLDGVKKGDTIATIHTNYGDVKVWFFPKYAPKAVENFTTHAKEGYYNGLIFHRVINNFMIQGGDPTGTGAGGESIWGKEFENEVNLNLRSFRGALCMANAGPDTNGSQFYIVQNPDIGDEMKSQLEELSKSDETFSESNGTKISFSKAFPSKVVKEYEENGGYPSLDMNYTVFGHGILVNNAATAENGILNGSLHLTAVGNDRVADLGGLIIVSWTGIIGTGINWPFRIEKCLRSLDIDQIHIGVVIALEICDGSEEAAVGNSSYIQLIMQLIDNVCKSKG